MMIYNFLPQWKHYGIIWIYPISHWEVFKSENKAGNTDYTFINISLFIMDPNFQKLNNRVKKFRTEKYFMRWDKLHTDEDNVTVRLTMLK